MLINRGRDIAHFVEVGFLPAFFTLIISIVLNLFTQINVFADDPSMAISSNGIIELEAHAGTFQSATFNVSVSTTNATGYTLMIETTGPTSSLVNVENSEYTIPTLSTSTGVLANSLYGNYGFSIDDSLYYPLPSPNAEAVEIAEYLHDGTNTHALTFGVHTTTSMPSGLYTGTYTLTAVANPASFEISYHANTDEIVEGIPATQASEPGALYDDLSSTEPTRDGYIFLGWDEDKNTSSPHYQAGDRYTFVDENRKNIRLYAIWAVDPNVAVLALNYGNSVEFTGVNYIDTDIPLFSSENVDIDFKVSVDIRSIQNLPGQDKNYNTIVSNMNEAGDPYPGFSLRKFGDVVELRKNSHIKSGISINVNVSEINHALISRTNKHLFYETNVSEKVEAIDMSQVPTFNAPMTFGAAYNGSLEPYRWFKGTLANMLVTRIYHKQDPSDVVTVTLPTPTLTDKVFRGWFSDADFSRKVANGGDTITLTNFTKLYAKFTAPAPDPDAEQFFEEGPVMFDGTNYIQTEIQLFKRQNVGRNFKVEFTIDSIDPDNIVQATFFNSLSEDGTPWPGIAARIKTANTTTVEVKANINGTRMAPNFNYSSGKMTFIRVDNKIYYSYDGKPFMKLADVNVEKDIFDTPVTFGASLDSNGEPWRYFKGTLSNISVQYLEDGLTIEDFEAPSKANTIVYQYSGEKVFNGPCVPSDEDDCSSPDAEKGYIDTGIDLFSTDTIDKDFTIEFDVVSVASGNTSLATLMNAYNEAGTPNSGLIYRIESSNLAFRAIKQDNTFVLKKEKSGAKHIKISRKNGSYYLKTSEQTGEELLMDITDFSTSGGQNVTFGSSSDQNGDPWRFFKGTLANMTIKLEE